jgi:hypothetical protein
MTEATPNTPMVMGNNNENGFKQLRQVTVRDDEEISKVNTLLGEGWRVVSIGHRADATVYVLGREEEKQRHRAGFQLGN